MSEEGTDLFRVPFEQEEGDGDLGIELGFGGRDHGEEAQRVERERQVVICEIERLGNEIREAAASGDGDRLRRLREQSGRQEEKLNAILDEKRRLEALLLSGTKVCPR